MKTCVVYAVFKLGTRILPLIVSVECRKASWKKVGLSSVYIVGAEVAQDNIGLRVHKID